jgi:hypothetical protein
MTAYSIESHPVAAFQIVDVGPLIAQGKMMSPDNGLTLVLRDGTTQKWLSEKDGALPSVGDWLIRDEELKVVYVVPAAKFTALFQEI